ncbi:hypothetical protein [Bacillus pseudomycoides]|uniref:hypothetical protein n=1 Tax=Bacillus pseudomycoides TaxID=64104 RepID=UPI000BF17B53|nr:hypothetical protein [Bacillus pseudomycoides]PEI52388.1 hypothetical protein CN641_00360 [Bacillus pseudomycoides]PHE91515.1 hypothetical protein COF78_19140 [Bacillus pseudomycoides]
MKDFRMQITLDEETDTYIRDYMEEHNIRYNGEAIVRICREHQATKSTEWSLNYVAEVVSKNLYDVLKSELTKIRLGSNSADRNTQVLIELMNGLFFHQGIQNIISTEVDEMDGVKTAKEVVEKRINHLRQKRLDHEAKKNNVT